jgi:hypothetical protein
VHSIVPVDLVDVTIYPHPEIERTDSAAVNAFLADGREDLRDLVASGDYALVHTYDAEEKLLRCSLLSAKIWPFEIDEVNSEHYPLIVRELTAVRLFTRDTIADACERVLTGKMTTTQ